MKKGIKITNNYLDKIKLFPPFTAECQICKKDQY